VTRIDHRCCVSEATRRIFVASVVSLVCTAVSTAQDRRGEPNAPPQGSAAQRILPLPDYNGDLVERRYLSGDWNEARAELARDGFQVAAQWCQYAQGVATGGVDRETLAGGSLDVRIDLDLTRMGVLPGALVKLRTESRYGESANGFAGAILPVNTDLFFPLTRDLDDDIILTVTDLAFTQFVTDHVALFLGKLDTLDRDPNEFASGRGVSQFMNGNFVFSSAIARLPYSSLGGGLLWLPAGDVTVTSSIVNTVDSSTTTGFDDFGDGLTWTTEADFQYRLGELPGGQNVGFLYAFDQDFTQFGGRFVFQPGQGIVVPTQDDTWAFYWSGWQYLSAEGQAPKNVDLADGRADMQGVGVFARVGFADEDTNPVEVAISGGIGGRGVIPRRDDDTFGVGYYYSRLQSTRLTGLVGLTEHVQGFEAYYDFALTPATHLTLDAQVVEPVDTTFDTAVVVGARFGVMF
jgi:porin